GRFATVDLPPLSATSATKSALLGHSPTPSLSTGYGRKADTAPHAAASAPRSASLWSRSHSARRRALRCVFTERSGGVHRSLRHLFKRAQVIGGGIAWLNQIVPLSEFHRMC